MSIILANNIKLTRREVREAIQFHKNRIKIFRGLLRKKKK